MGVRGPLALAVVLAALAAPAPASAGWTRVGELPSSPGDTRADALTLPAGGLGLVTFELVGNQFNIRLRYGRINAVGNIEQLATDPVATGIPAASPRLLAAMLPTAGAVAAWAEKDPDGVHEHLRVVQVGGSGTDIGPPVPPGTERDVEPLSLAVSPTGTIAVAYLARLASGDRHVRAFVYASGIWQALQSGPFFTGAGSEPADSAALAWDSGALVALTGDASTATVSIERSTGGTGWAPGGQLGPGLSAAGLQAIPGGGVRLLASGPFGVVSQLYAPLGVGPVETLPGSGVGPSVAFLGDGPCALLEGDPSSATNLPVLRATCLGQSWTPVGPALPVSSRATQGLSLTSSGQGTFALTAAPDGTGPHVVEWRLDPDVSSTAAVTGTSTASLLASIDPQGRSTTAWFEYGPTTAYGAKTPPVQLDATDRPVPLGAQLTGLKPGTTYHYRVSADNGAGTVGFGDQTFTVGKDSTPPAFVLSLPGSVHPGKTFALHLRDSEAGTLKLELADGKLRVLRRWTIKLPPPSSRPTLLRRYLPKLRKLKPGRYIWLASAKDTAGNTANARPRSVVVYKR